MNISAENTLRKIYEEKKKKEMGIDIVEEIVKGLLIHLEVDYSEYTIKETSRYEITRFFRKIGYRYRADFCVDSKIAVFRKDYARVYVETDLERKITEVRLNLLDSTFEKVGCILQVTDEKEIKQIQMAARLSK